MKKGDKVIIIKENLYFNVGTVCELLGKGWDGALLLGINKHGNLHQAYIYNDRYKLCKEEDLLEQARLKYPVGTKYKNAHKYAQGENTIHEIKGTDFYWHEQYVSISERSSSGIVYYLPDDRWAEITNKDQNTIPEYVECIDNSYFCGGCFKFTIGKIYKFPNGKDDVNRNYSLNSCFYENWTKEFKPSTKEAYDAQNKCEWIPKVGDWVVVTEKYSSNRSCLGYIGKLTNICNNSHIKYEVDNSWCIDVRKAFPHEIPEEGIAFGNHAYSEISKFNDLVDIGVYPYPTSNKEEFTGKLIKTKSKIKKQVIVAPQKPIRLKTIKIK